MSSKPMGEREMKKFRATVTMKKPWVSEWMFEPSVDNVMEAFADDIRTKVIDKLFEIVVKKAK